MKERNSTVKYSPRIKTILWLIQMLVIIILIQSASAQEANEVKEFGIYKINYINLLVYENGFVDVEVGLEVNNTIAGILTLGDIRDVVIKDSRGNTLQYDVDPAGGRQLLTFYLRTTDDRNIRLQYKTLDLTSKKGSIWSFNFSTTSTPGQTIVNVRFPEGTDVLSLRPKDILRSSKNLTAEMSLYPQTTYFSFEYDYRINQRGVVGQDNIFYFLAVIALFLLVFVYSVFRRRRKGVSKERTEDGVVGEGGDVIEVPEGGHEGMEVSHIEDVTLVEGAQSRKIKSSVINMLEENERKVLGVIEQADDEITQAYIYKTTGIPKATLSDLMKRLEKRNIIERRKEGRTNWIKIQKWVFNE
ncbi:MAG: winged helix-turn-helix transcriptional regulator [Candidatus Altiarchaeota archaeon]|nr:winged helix-turn-helix transcriptional regulator [Candidatus Altiarchaeota archaeon]